MVTEQQFCFSFFCRRHTVSLSAPPAPPIAIKRLGSASTRFMQHALKPACRIDIGAPAKCAAQSCPIIRRIIRNTPYNTGFGATVSYLYAVLYGVLYLNPKIRRIIRESKAPYRIFRIVLGLLANSDYTAHTAAHARSLRRHTPKRCAKGALVSQSPPLRARPAAARAPRRQHDARTHARNWLLRWRARAGRPRRRGARGARRRARGGFRGARTARGEPRRAASGDGGWREEVRVRFREESASRQTHAHSPACGASAPLRCAAVAAAAARVSALPRLSAEGSTLAPRALMPCTGVGGKGGQTRNTML